jgi:hypothetical protein
VNCFLNHNPPQCVVSAKNPRISPTKQNRNSSKKTRPPSRSVAPFLPVHLCRARTFRGPLVALGHGAAFSIRVTPRPRLNILLHLLEVRPDHFRTPNPISVVRNTDCLTAPRLLHSRVRSDTLSSCSSPALPAIMAPLCYLSVKG